MKEAGCRLLIVGYESGDQQILKNIKKGATIERARQFTKDCHKLGLVVHGDFIIGLPGESRETIKNTINFAKELDVETIQVSVAHAYPGTELHEFAIKNGFMTSDTKMVDDGGHRWCRSNIPACPLPNCWKPSITFTTPIISVPRLRTVFCGKRSSTTPSAKRLYKEARTFLKLRAQRHKWSRQGARKKRPRRPRPRQPLNH